MNLELEGYRVITASDGEEGLARIHEDRPDIIVLDVMMPKMDGLAMTRAVKGDTELRDIPIVLLSARTAAADVDRGLAAGADRYVTKPFDIPVLLDTLTALLAKTR
jgi:two-component system phosphate regulon response regulator PhoB